MPKNKPSANTASAAPPAPQPRSPQVTVKISLGSSVSRRIRRIKEWEERSAVTPHTLTGCE